MEHQKLSQKLTGKIFSEPEAFSWPVSRLGEALEILARKSSLKPLPIEMPGPPQSIIQQFQTESQTAGGDSGAGKALEQWIESAVSYLGLEAEPIDITYDMTGRLLQGAAPALIPLPGQPGHPGFQEAPRFLALVPGKRQGRKNQPLSILGPDHKVHRIALETVQAILCQGLESYLAPEIDRLFAEVMVSRQRHAQARAVILSEHLGPVPVTRCWLLRLSPGAGFWQQMRQARLPRSFCALTGAYTVQYALMVFAWWVIGRGALQGNLDLGWLLAWALLLFTMIPFQMAATWFQGALAINAGGLLKQRLLYGALQLEPEEISHQGAGQLLGRVIESEALESLALNSGFTSIAMIIELIAATVVLGIGTGGRLNILLFLVWVMISLFWGWRYLTDRWEWTKMRLEMTHDLVERMVGHRTRLAQERREHWHDGEDQAVERYLELSKAMDSRAVLLTTLIPSGWLVLGLAGLSVAFVSGQAGSVGVLAVGLAGVLLAQRALGKLPAGLMSLADTVIAWKQVAPLFHAAGRPRACGLPSSSALVHTHEPHSPKENEQNEQHEQYPVIEMHNCAFRYRGRSEPVIYGCSLQIRAGDQLLLEGPSGGGKSTLASLLIGLRAPESGLLLMRGLDLSTVGTQTWRRRVAAAPQFHENHVLTGTLAFNLLMGRRWPPQPGDLEEAEAVCRKLGLGSLLDRMPAGLMQMVGETGWQLSHGEKSRIYIARALLQGADLIILDESFAALDPESLHQALAYVLEQAPTLLVIAHP
ncbi:MAG: ABC transporter ATP-binding protein [bacterium]